MVLTANCADYPCQRKAEKGAKSAAKWVASTSPVSDSFTSANFISSSGPATNIWQKLRPVWLPRFGMEERFNFTVSRADTFPNVDEHSYFPYHDKYVIHYDFEGVGRSHSSPLRAHPVRPCPCMSWPG